MHKNAMNVPQTNKDRCKVTYEDCFCKPLFSNVYKVILCTLTKRMKCTCSTVTRIGMPCQHIYAIIGIRYPDMFHVRWLSVYNTLLVDASNELKVALESMRDEHYRSFDAIYIGSVLHKLPKYEGLQLEMSGTTATFMFQAYICHLYGQAVIRDGSQFPSVPGLDYGKDHPEFTELFNHCLPLIYDKDDKDRDALIQPALSEESNPDHIVSRKKERVKTSTLEADMVRYHQLMQRFQDLSKLGEGRPDLYEEMLMKLDDLKIEFTGKAISGNKKLLQEEQQRSTSKLVSSNASLECTPNRGRYKGSHER